MSLNQSYLSSPKYGYSLAVGATQQSINSTMKAYLSTLSQPLVNICYVADERGNPKQIPYDELLILSKGADPFTIATGADPATNPGLKDLLAARFMVGFRARIGIPPKFTPDTIPDIVTLGTSFENVGFRLMCSEFTVVSLTPAGGYNPAKWLNVSQGDTDAWFFESTVNLRQIDVLASDYYTLPSDVQRSIDKMKAGTFGVQQLLFDLDNAAVQSVPIIKGVEIGSELYTVLFQYFVSTYFAQLQIDGQPVLGCTVTRIAPDGSTLDVTNIQLQVGPYVDSMGQVVPNPTEEEKRLSTLNYLCMVDNLNPLPPVPFDWNWITKDDAADGVVALNRDAFARYLKNQMYYSIQRCCYKPWVRVWDEWTWYGAVTVYYQWSLAPFQTPTVTFPSAGGKVIESRYSDKAGDRAGVNGALGEMKLEPQFDVDVTFSGNQIVVVQYLKVYCYVSFLASSGSGNVVDIKLTDTFTLGVDATGHLTSTKTTKREDNSRLPGQNGFLNFFADLNSLVKTVSEWAGQLADISFNDLPISVIQSLIFPGGNEFVFKDIIFSNKEDLVCRVVYADPAKNLHLTKLGRTARPLLKATVPADQVPSARRPLLT